MDKQALVILQHDARGVYVLTMNQPQSLNALSEQMIDALQSALAEVVADAHSRVLVIAANGKAFCPGHNLKDMYAHAKSAYYQDLFMRCSRMMLAIAKLPIPVIARVHGIATAAGCQLVAQCDLAVASPSVQFATSGINYGLFCATPSVPLVRNVPAKHAMYMLMTGEFIDAATALQYGLINIVAAQDGAEALDAELDKLIATLLSKPRLALQLGKELFYRQQGVGLAAAYQLAEQTMATNLMDACGQEGLRAFVEKRLPLYK